MATLAAGATVTRNLLRFHDPFYPLQVRVAGTMVFDGPEDPTRDADYPAYLLYGSTAVRFPEPINFILSATELDWTMRGVAPWYNIDSVTGKSPRRGPESRAGGWGGLFVLVNFWLLAVQLLRPRLLSDSRQRLLAVNALLITAATACLPRAHELRYWLFVPLILIPVNLRFLCAADAERRFMPQMLAAMMLYGMATAVLSPKSGLLEPRLVTQHNRRMDVPQAVRQALDTTGRYCNPLDELLFRYSPGATGLQGLVSRNARDCP